MTVQGTLAANQGAAAAAPPKLESGAEQVAALADKSPMYAAALATHQAVAALAVEALQLTPVCSTRSGCQDGIFTAASADGISAAVAQAYHGGPVHWLSSSALCNNAMGFGTCRLLGWVEGDRDAPHLALEHGLVGDRVQALITLWPRQNWVTDLDYLQRYYNSAPGGCGRSYNDVMNGMMATAEAQPGWHHYTSPVAQVKPLLAASISYSFPAHQDNLDLWRAAALEVAQMWVAFLHETPSEARSKSEQQRLDSRYFGSITSDPANSIAQRLFGEEATNTLLKMATGHPAVDS